MLISGCSTSNYEIDEADYVEVDYINMWENYLDREHKDLKVKITGEISSIDSRRFNISEGLTGLTGMINIEPRRRSDLSDYSVGDRVTVLGRVDRKVMGYLYIKEATIRKATTDEINRIHDYEWDRTLQDIDAMIDYKMSASTVNYDALIRNPSNYIGQIIKVTVRIAQVMPGGVLREAGYRGYEGSGTSNEWYIAYDLPDGSSRILDGDTVTFYGEFTGLTTITRGLTGARVEVPRLKAQYHD
jgi:hypothetical protein